MNSPRGIDRTSWPKIREEATALLQALIRIDTTNPPGNEIEAARCLEQSLAADGLRAEIIESAPGRANLICRVGSTSVAPPLLLAGHLDVVPAGDVSRWTHPPFSGARAEGMIWGRGSIDMKNMVAMSAMVLKLIARTETRLRRDVILAAVADEEEGCAHGSRFLVENHPEKVRAEFGLGEVGGFPSVAGRAMFMPVQVAEKGICWLRMTANGTSGHGSMPRPDNANATLARAIDRLHRTHLPQHNTAVMEEFIQRLARLQPLPKRVILSQILNPRLSRMILERLFPDKAQGRLFSSLLRNTVSPTVLRAGSRINVIPDAAWAELDGRLIPGQSTETFLTELRHVVGDEVELQIIREAPGTANYPYDSALWQTIVRTIGTRKPGLAVLPYMIPGFTDGIQFSRLGTRWYGFSPIWIEPSSGIRFADLYHGIDERIPEEGYHWGLGVLFDVVRDFAGECSQPRQ
jgi:acetylornithine deacetylase/succinyl-diaminopimelate desuccinylase-like protein